MLVRIIYVYSIALESLEPRGLCGGNAHLRFAAVTVRQGAAALAGGHPKEAPHVGLAPQREYLSWGRNPTNPWVVPKEPFFAEPGEPAS